VNYRAASRIAGQEAIGGQSRALPHDQPLDPDQELHLWPHKALGIAGHPICDLAPSSRRW
jgi:hypothetical protein